MQHYWKLAVCGLLLALSACTQPQVSDEETYPDEAKFYSLDEGLVQPAEAANGIGLKVLKPGGIRELNQTLKVNVVFVGYQAGSGAAQVALDQFKAGLPQNYRTIARIPSFYLQANNQPNEDLAINFSYDYNIKFASQHFEDDFFGYLGHLAIPQPLTLFQTAYNCQFVPNAQNPPCASPSPTIAKAVTENHWIDAVKVERWLVNHADQAGVNPHHYTVFLVNWYGRPDFKFHVYTKTNEPDPDTGYNFGEARASRKIAGWGGTAYNDPQNGNGEVARVWFYDLSAGPIGNTSNWDITDPDLNDDKTLDYRIPPIWEYGSSKGYRPFDDLSGDLAKLTRFVAINLLFTTSPLYRPAISPPHQPRRVNVDIAVYQGNPAVNGLNLFKPKLLTERWEDLQHLNSFDLKLSELPFTGDAVTAYKCYIENQPTDPCNILGGVPSFVALFAHNVVNNTQNAITGTGNRYDYVIPSYAYNVTEPIPFLGLADDNYQNGVQTVTFGALNPTAGQFYGFSITFIHEIGHHLGISHPHDGYDYEANVDYGPGGPFQFAWAGDESSSVMSYLDLNDGFGQFDYDNMNRYLTSVYLNKTNAILALVNAHPKAGRIGGKVKRADRQAAEALEDYQAMRYETALSKAEKAYDQVLKASETLGIGLNPSLWYTDFGLSLPNPPPFIAKIDPQHSDKVRIPRNYALDGNPEHQKHRHQP